MKVEKVNSDGSAVVSTRGYRRILSQPDGRPMIEFVRAAYAAKCVAGYNACFPGGEHWAEAVTYKESARQGAKKPTLKVGAKLRVANVA